MISVILQPLVMLLLTEEAHDAADANCILVSFCLRRVLIGISRICEIG
jgi:hypothetical protein